MRYSTKPRFGNYVKGYGCLSFAKKFGDKDGKKIMDTATKTGIDAAKLREILTLLVMMKLVMMQTQQK